MRPMVLSVVERCPLFGSVIFSHCIWDESMCPFFRGIRCIEVSVDGGSTLSVF